MSMVSDWLLGIAEQAFPFDFDKQDELQSAFLDGDLNALRRLSRETSAEGQKAIQRGWTYWNRSRRASTSKKAWRGEEYTSWEEEAQDEWMNSLPRKYWEAVHDLLELDMGWEHLEVFIDFPKSSQSGSWYYHAVYLDDLDREKARDKLMRSRKRDYEEAYRLTRKLRSRRVSASGLPITILRRKSKYHNKQRNLHHLNEEARSWFDFAKLRASQGKDIVNVPFPRMLYWEEVRVHGPVALTSRGRPFWIDGDPEKQPEFVRLKRPMTEEEWDSFYRSGGKGRMASLMQHPMSLRVASTYHEAHFEVSAKSKYLKAIDFSFGVLNRMKRAGYKFMDASLDEIRTRLIFLRQIIQKQGTINLRHLEEQVGKIQSKSQSLLKKLEDKEQSLIPSMKHYDSFMKAYPDKSKQRAKEQEARFMKILVPKFKMDARTIAMRTMRDASFAKEVYDAILPELKRAYMEFSNKIPSVGRPQSRIKQFESAFKKQRKKGYSFLSFPDLIGYRVITQDVPGMAEAGDAIQSSFKISEKDNKYLDNMAYLAIHYGVMASNGVLIEVQLKTDDNIVEAAISHDILYKPEMSMISLSDQERQMVQTVVDVSIQVSLDQLESYMDSVAQSEAA
jgi:ppGpp synthetase/RelA/SpoT-type nucleotidyltranferase